MLTFPLLINIKLSFMANSYFILTCVDLHFPFYVAFDGSVSVADARKHITLALVLRNVALLSLSEYRISPCQYKDFKEGLLKIDFRLNNS